ncbi:translation initiation factor IF-2-like [Dryobates pubescens]|uniref:translation initiation factor IF-2-like n=1 Tax=Dryobates pubescens TaxID=118200 RepID=UPI0023B90145|nr:translation initiation factor IF-2-like [Dryobates pubescens]
MSVPVRITERETRDRISRRDAPVCVRSRSAQEPHREPRWQDTVQPSRRQSRGGCRSAPLQNRENETFEVESPARKTPPPLPLCMRAPAASGRRRAGGAGRGGGRGRDLPFEFPNIAGSADYPRPAALQLPPRWGGQGAGHARPAQQVGSAPAAGGGEGRGEGGRALGGDAGPRPGAAEPGARRGGGEGRCGGSAARRRGRAGTGGGAQHPELGLRAAARMRSSSSGELENAGKQKRLEGDPHPAPRRSSRSGSHPTGAAAAGPGGRSRLRQQKRAKSRRSALLKGATGSGTESHPPLQPGGED